MLERQGQADEILEAFSDVELLASKDVQMACQRAMTALGHLVLITVDPASEPVGRKRASFDAGEALDSLREAVRRELAVPTETKTETRASRMSSGPSRSADVPAGQGSGG